MRYSYFQKPNYPHLTEEVEGNETQKLQKFDRYAMAIVIAQYARDSRAMAATTVNKAKIAKQNRKQAGGQLDTRNYKYDERIVLMCENYG